MKSHFVFLSGLFGGDSPFILKTLPAKLKARGIDFTCVVPLPKAEIWDAAIDADRFIKSQIVPKFGPNIHLLGHSMGGLIGRYLISHVWDEKSYEIRSFTSLSTPHLGTPLGTGVNPLLMNFIHPAIDDMGFQGVQKFNVSGSPQYSPPHPLIQNYSWGAMIPSMFKAGDFVSWYGWTKMKESLAKSGQDTRNDGVVPLFSQVFGRYLGTLEVNHKYFSLESSYKSPDVVSFYENHFKFLEMERQDLTALLSPYSA